MPIVVGKFKTKKSLFNVGFGYNKITLAEAITWIPGYQNTEYKAEPV